ncbi:MAG: hypothetical protein IPH07_24380 [Deltaproteobacteria bacterium]|nr:hypothetical protein [Deltaproteobacteria bacterium]
MAAGFHEVLFEGGAQDLIHVPPSRVASASVQVEDLTEPDDGADRFIVANGAATVDSYSTTSTAAAGAGQPDPRLVTHAGATATAGRAYEITASDGRRELFAAETVTATTLRSATPLSGAYASGATVRGVQLSVAFPSLAAADADIFEADHPLRVRWQYTAPDGATWRVDELVRLVRGSATARHLAAVELDLRASKCELVRLLGPQASALRNLVASVSRRLTADLRGKGIDPNRYFAGDEGYELLKQACVLEMAEDGLAPANMDAAGFAALQSQKFGRMWQQATRGSDSAVAATTTRVDDTAAAGSSKVVRSPWRRG